MVQDTDLTEVVIVKNKRSGYYSRGVIVVILTGNERD